MILAVKFTQQRRSKLSARMTSAQYVLNACWASIVTTM